MLLFGARARDENEAQIPCVSGVDERAKYRLPIVWAGTALVAGLFDPTTMRDRFDFSDVTYRSYEEAQTGQR